MKNNFFGKLSVKDGELDFPSKIHKTRLNTFLKEIPDGTQM